HMVLRIVEFLAHQHCGTADEPREPAPDLPRPGLVVRRHGDRIESLAPRLDHHVPGRQRGRAQREGVDVEVGRQHTNAPGPRRRARRRGGRGGGGGPRRGAGGGGLRPPPPGAGGAPPPPPTPPTPCPHRAPQTNKPTRTARAPTGGNGPPPPAPAAVLPKTT